MGLYQGDYLEDATVYIPLNTFTSDDPSASSTITNFANTDVHIHKNDGLTQRNNAAGITVSIDFDGITGNHMIKIDTSDDTVADFWVTGADYFVRIEGTTVDGATINAWVGHFSIENRFKEVDLTHIMGHLLTQTGTQIADAFEKFFDVGTPTGTVNSLPAGAADAAGGLVVSDAGGLDIDTKLANTNEITVARMGVLTDWINAGRLDAILDLIAADVVNVDGSSIPSAAAIVNEWETQSQADPTGFHVNVMEWLSQACATPTVNGVPEVDLTHIMGTILTEGAGGRLAAAFIKLLDVVTPVLVASDAMRGTNSAATAAKLLSYIQLLARSDAAIETDNSTELTEINADGGSGAGNYSSQTDSGEAVRDVAPHGSTMVGTDNANTTVPDAAGTAATPTEVATALSDINLDHLMKTATAGADMTTEVADNTVLSRMLANGDTSGFVPSTDGLQPIRDRGDAAWTTGGGGSISDILNIETLIPNSIDLANTATVRLGLGLTNMVDDLPSTAEITPGTITIDRKAIGGTSWSNVVNAAACSEAVGLIYYDEVFDAGTGYAEGDSIRITFKSQKITVAANDYEITGTDGWVYQTFIREAMVGTNNAYTGTPPTVTQIQAEMEEDGASLLDTIRDVVNHTDYGNAKLVRATTPANKLDVSATGEAGLDFDNVKNASGAHTLTNITVPTVTTTGTVSGNVDGSVASVSGAVNSVTQAVTVGTNNDKTGYGLANGAIAAGTIAANAITADKIAANAISASKIATNAITADKIAADAIDAAALKTDAVTEIQSGLAIEANVAGHVTTSLNTYDPPTKGEMDAAHALLATPSQVNAQVLDVLNVDTFAEPGQGVPSTTDTLVNKIGLIHKGQVNKEEQTASEYKLYNNAGDTVDQKAAVSDDNTTFTKGKLESGA